MVISIITLMVGISAPAVLSVTEQARKASCRMQLAGLSKAMIAYGADFGGWLPPGPAERGYWTGDADRGSPYELYDAYRISDPGLYSDGGWYGAGLTWKHQYIEQGEQYYCPAAERRGGVGCRQAWPKSFTPDRDPADGTSRIFFTYAYRGGLRSQAGTALGPVNLSRHSGSLPVLADNPCNRRMWHDGGYNIAFLDGRVEFRPFSAPIVLRGELPALWTALDNP